VEVRHSPDLKANAQLKELPARGGEGNVAWLRRTGIRDGVLLVGGSSVIEFRIRVAQSRFRQDLLPSFWSMAGLLTGSRVHTVADLRRLERVPEDNGVQRISLRELDDPRTYPNLAILQFAERHRPVQDAIQRIHEQRGIIDIPALIVPWLGFLWGVGAHNNPLVEGKGLPSAILIETAFGMAGVDLTPGLSSMATCPEAIWQAAKWWTSYYTEAARDVPTGAVAPLRPTGAYVCRQPAAYVVEEPARKRQARRPRRQTRRRG
jgi:hypothetical protein